MQGLLLKLSMLDAAAENAVRLISFFDTLVEQRVDLRRLLRSAAMVADCDVGVIHPARGEALRASPDGSLAPEGPPSGACVRDLRSGHVVWMGRGVDDALPLDEILLERFAISCVAVIGRNKEPPGLGDPALLELVIGRSASVADRVRALHLLGLSPRAEVTVLAMSGPWDALAAVESRLSRGAWHRCLGLGELHAIVAAGTVPRDLTAPAGVRIGVATPVRATDLPSGWTGAVRALRFSTEEAPGSPERRGPLDRAVVFQADLGPYELLAARLRSTDIVGIADVDAFDRLAGQPAGADVVAAVEAVVASGTLREAARHLHLHHNTVAARLARAQAVLGYPVATPHGLARVGLALALRRLRINDMQE